MLNRQLWEYEQNPNQYYDPQNRIDGAYYVTNGDYPFYERRNTVTYTLNGDYSRKLGKSIEEGGHPHNIMLGGDINYNNLSFLLTQFPNITPAQQEHRPDSICHAIAYR